VRGSYGVHRLAPTTLPSISDVHLRRALLLFAIVLGLAAFAASISRPGKDSRESEQTTAPPQGEPTVAPGPAEERPVTLRFNAEREQVRRLEVGQAATLQVSVDEPGQVEIPLLGQADAAEPVTPARFEIFASEPGRYPIGFTPASGEESRPAGILDVTPAEP
jgi:hypothetical protein